MRPGSVRVRSDGPPLLPNAAFRTPSGDVVLIVLNDGRVSRTFSIGYRTQHARATLPAGALATCVWHAG